MTPLERLRSDLRLARGWADHFASQAERDRRHGRPAASIRAAERKVVKFEAKAAEYERAVAILSQGERDGEAEARPL